MNNREIESKIQSAIADITPNVLDRVLSSDVQKEERLDGMASIKRFAKAKWIAGAAVAACAALLITFGSIFYINNGITDSMILLDVNPSIAFTTNKSDKVLEASAQNDDGEKVLDGMDLKGVDINVAVNAVIGSMVKQGYLTSTDNSILVSVDNKDISKAEALKSEIVQDISITLKNQNIDGTIYNQTLDFSQDGLEELSKKYSISIGKAVFLAKLTTVYPEFNYDELAKMDIEDIAQLVEGQNLDLRKVIDCDGDDSIQENIEDAIDDINESSAPSEGTTSSSYISAARAEEVALKHAGLSGGEVYFVKSELEHDDGRVIYEIEFYSKDNNEYDYEIDAVNGDILSFDRDAENYNGKAPNSSSPYIGTDKAKEIALNHAGLSSGEVYFVKSELEHDDGRVIYEIEFYSKDNNEYDYEIDAVNGDILSFDRDAENYNGKAPNSSSPYIGTDKAKEIALNHAGLSINDVSFIKAELDRDDGRVEYELEFRKGRTEYEYTIDASSGKILSAEQDIDD